MAGPYGGLDRLGVGFVEDRKLRPLAVADLPAQRLRLAIGHPEAGPISVRIGGEPQPEGIDAAVGEAVSAKRSPAWDARSDERRVGKGCVSTCRSRWAPDH